MLLVALVIVRVASVTWSATSRTRGDFYASMPGAYVETLNPDLWNSPDMAGAWGYHNHTYFHGPIQYLTLYPMAFFDTFAEIARVLLPLYALLLVLAFWLMWKAAQRLGAGPAMFVPLLASTFLFFPLLQAYLQREFEVVMTAALAGAMLALVSERRAAAAALLAYVTWFKYIPLLFGCWLILRRWWRAAAIYAAVSAAILVLSHWLFDLSRFFNNNVPGHAAQVFVLWGHGFGVDATGHLYGTGFCEGWFDNESTLSNLRHGLCTMAAYNSWVHPPLIYLTICLAVAVVYLRTHFRLERMPLAAGVEARRRLLELSIITTICACFFFSHYYYLIVLVIPFNVLFMLYLLDRRYAALSLWAIAYFLVSAFVVPMTLMSRVAGFDMWEPYIWQGWFWYGEVLLVVLLINEYRRLAGSHASSAADTSRR
jgi:hypothetical protein